MAARKTILRTGLTPSEEALCHAYFVFHSQIDAYIHVYLGGVEPAKRDSARVNANNIFKKPRIKKRIDELLTLSESAIGFTIETAHQEAALAFHLSTMLLDPGHMLLATRLRAELNGFLIKRKMDVKKPLREMSREELIAEAQGIAGELGITLRIPKTIQGN